MSDTVTRKVAGIDTICWMVPNPAIKRGHEHHSANRGEVVELPVAEAERLAAYLVDVDVDVEMPSIAWAPADEDVIAAMTVAEVVAYLGQTPEDDHDEELERILEIENARPQARVGVLALDPDFEADPDDDAGS